VHASGQAIRTGEITKAGQRDLRFTMIKAAQLTDISYPHWQAELACLESRLRRNKAIVAVSHKLLIAV
jgi:hypothetical protein